MAEFNKCRDSITLPIYLPHHILRATTLSAKRNLKLFKAALRIHI